MRSGSTMPLKYHLLKDQRMTASSCHLRGSWVPRTVRRPAPRGEELLNELYLVVLTAVCCVYFAFPDFASTAVLAMAAAMELFKALPPFC